MVAILKNGKIAIPPQQFDWFRWKLA